MTTATIQTPMTLEKPLIVPELDTMKQELIVQPDAANTVDVSDEVKTQADAWITKILAIEPRDLDAQQSATLTAKGLGGDVETELTEKSKLLQGPLSELMNDADNGSDVANDLLKLEETARSIDPNGFDFSNVSGIRVFLSYLGVPTPLTRWIAKYQSTEAIINSIEEGLKQGKAKLQRDNVVLKEDQTNYRKVLFRLDDYIAFAQYVDSQLEVKVNAETDADKQRFLKDEVLFPVRQRFQDLLTSKAVYQQAWVTSEFIMKTNEELIRGVDRALKHTMVALSVASSLAIALARQKRVIVALQSAKATTEKMIQDISDQLLTQGTQIMAQASEPYIQVEVMKNAFSKTLQAMDEVSKYRSEAIVSMKAGIGELKTMTDDMDKNVQRIEQGQDARDQFKVLLD
ncbi:toxic anion resistance family protein [Alteromonas macleodii]|uniref:Toxic anion resistance family protein n=2 Tax=Alteromonas macleodii TaxID=28108 RepID=A0AB36FS39_ALTMA|nr:toxic anion resistance family protein [Alteromonas macleodii]OES24806.1 toxic anion resistance family protein [Alteromonas macleodii]OES25084.1 toxic anion resistance family protein [Alteromonas macleodii]OES39127.1 toxic anion resistance family protein [Alteromonas macleodii]